MSKSKATSFDIAHYAGVSQSTVSRALRNSPLVNEETKKKVFEIAKKLNYKVDKNASNLRTQQSNTIALLLFEDPTSDESMINPFFLSMLGSITRACANQGYDLLVSFQQMDQDWQAQYEDSHRADGLILLGYGDYIDYQARLATLLQNNTKFVCWGARVESRPELSISCDNYFGGEQVAEFLVAKKRTQCAFIGDASEHSPEFFARFNGFKDTLNKHGLDVDARQIINAISTDESGYNATKTLLSLKRPINAIFAASDLIAIGAIRAIKEAGLVKEDIDILIHCSVCRDFIEPGTASVVHSKMKLAPHCLNFDISNACLGMLSGMNVLAAMVQSGRIKRGLLVSGEIGFPLLQQTIATLNADQTLTRKSIKPHFASLTIGSAASAIIISHESVASEDAHQLLATADYSHTEYNHLCQGNADSGIGGNSAPLMETDSEELLVRGIEAAENCFPNFLEEAEWTKEDIDKACTHQVGIAHRNLLYKQLGLDSSNDFMTFNELGNCGSASLPITAAAAYANGHLKKGDNVAFLGIGSGINCTMAAIKW